MKSRYILEIEKIEEVEEYEPQTLSEKIYDSSFELALFLFGLSYILLYFWSWQLLPEQDISFLNVFLNLIATTFIFIFVSPVIAVGSALLPFGLYFLVLLIEYVIKFFSAIRFKFKKQVSQPISIVQKEMETLQKFGKNKSNYNVV